MRSLRAAIIRQALERHLVVLDCEPTPPRRQLPTLLSLAGAGVADSGPRSAEEIDAHIRWLRGEG
jgi:hypothetical protein